MNHRTIFFQQSFDERTLWKERNLSVISVWFYFKSKSQTALTLNTYRKLVRSSWWSFSSFDCQLNYLWFWLDLCMTSKCCFYFSILTFLSNYWYKKAMIVVCSMLTRRYVSLPMRIRQIFHQSNTILIHLRSIISSFLNR